MLGFAFLHLVEDLLKKGAKVGFICISVTEIIIHVKLSKELLQECLLLKILHLKRLTLLRLNKKLLPESSIILNFLPYCLGISGKKHGRKCLSVAESRGAERHDETPWAVFATREICFACCDVFIGGGKWSENFTLDCLSRCGSI